VVYAPPLPRLSARCEGANLLLSWPTNFTGFLLEYLTTPGTNWLKLKAAPAVVNDHFTITKNDLRLWGILTTQATMTFAPTQPAGLAEYDPQGKANWLIVNPSGVILHCPGTV